MGHSLDSVHLPLKIKTWLPQTHLNIFWFNKAVAAKLSTEMARYKVSCAYQGVRNICFSENLLCFLETSVLRFALLPYYRRFYCFKLTMHLVLPNIFKKKNHIFLQNNFKIIIYLKLMRSKGALQVWCLLQCIY